MDKILVEGIYEHNRDCFHLNSIVHIWSSSSVFWFLLRVIFANVLFVSVIFFTRRKIRDSNDKCWQKTISFWCLSQTSNVQKQRISVWLLFRPFIVNANSTHVLRGESRFDTQKNQTEQDTKRHIFSTPEIQITVLLVLLSLLLPYRFIKAFEFEYMQFLLACLPALSINEWALCVCMCALNGTCCANKPKLSRCAY